MRIKSVCLNWAFLLTFLFSATLSLSSCKDDKDEVSSSNDELVGTWYFYYDGEIDYEDSWTFRNNGTAILCYYDESYSARYTYDAASDMITLVWQDADWGTEKYRIYFISKDKISIDDEIYVRR